ncbi:hypothetical protein C1H76_2024 [Elsinoe australis]|uniref:MYND-type domain-containing protein n=1 Tax=Elsinoe australis TaxID=40998 RepID=A0A4U7B7J9_9PEZI|nr:hypothetical protein C1H76_2024 [Elsinoe australis]
MHLHVFDAGLDDGALHLLCSPPNSTGQVHSTRAFSNIIPSTSVQSTNKITGLNDKDRASLTCVAHYQDEKAEILASGGAVKVAQESPCSMTVIVGTSEHVLEYPFPVHGSTSKTRIARKQHWVEVTVKQAKDSSQRYRLQPFPLITAGRASIFPWNVTLLNLDVRPKIPAGSKFPALSATLGMGLSNAERIMNQDKSLVSDSRHLLDLKETIGSMFTTCLENIANRSRDGVTCFGLTTDNDIDTIVLIQCVRHELHSSSIVLDGYVAPLDDSRCSVLATTLGTLVQRKKMNAISVNNDEALLWKHLIPALVERCRFDWTHRQDCAYRSLGARIPLSVSHGGIPICSCGVGKGASSPPEFKAFEKFATRVAISPLSAIICDVPMIPDGVNDMRRRQAGATPRSATASARPTAGTSTTVQACNDCGATKADLKSCKRCGLAKYCNHDCQKTAWKTHKKECKAV